MTTTYLQAVNDVLVRLRETEVSTVNETSYSKLIGKLVNDAKTQVEAAYNWNALSQTLTATTTADLFSYVLVGSGVRFRVTDVINDTSNFFMDNATSSWMNEKFLINNVQKGAPQYFNFNGQDSSGDTLVDIFPVPDGVYNIRFNVFLPQEQLSSDNTVIKVPGDVVILMAYARALVERGEDSGLASSEAYQLAKNLMSDYIALEANRYIEDTNWVSV
jgi:hypothetical protein